MNVCTATQSASARTAFSTSQAMPPPLDMSSKSTVESYVTRTHFATRAAGDMQVRKMPRVPISTSTWGISGGITTSMRSSPDVGPMM